MRGRLLALPGLAALLSTAALAQSPNSVSTGVLYGAAGDEGEEVYFAASARCHGDDLGGLERGTFAQRWPAPT